MTQALIVALIVAASAGYAAWALMPRAWRQSLARRLHWADPAPGCGGCDNCGSAAKPDGAAHGESVVRLHRPRR